MLGTSWECHKVREFALRPMGDFLLVLDRMNAPIKAQTAQKSWQHKTLNKQIKERSTA